MALAYQFHNFITRYSPTVRARTRGLPIGIITRMGPGRLQWRSGAAILIPLLMAILFACTPAPTPTLMSATPTGQLTPFPELSPSPTPERSFVQPAPSQTPLPTPTPFTHTVVEGDTLLAIAFRYSVTLDELLAANPGVDPRLLSVGMSLIVPIGEGELAIIPSPTPIDLDLQSPNCFPSADEGLWCFLAVTNTFPDVLEGVLAEIILFDGRGTVIMSQDALPALNIIPPGEAVPLTAFFSPPAPADLHASGLLKAAFRVSPDDGRYLPVRIERRTVQIDPDALAASVNGTLIMEGVDLEGQSGALRIRLVAVAYDAGGAVIGVRQWEQERALSESRSIPFELQVYSLGPSIEEVDLIAEAQRELEAGQN